MNQNNIIEEFREKFTIRSSDGIDWETVKQSSWSLENWLAIKIAEAKEAGAREERERILDAYAQSGLVIQGIEKISEDTLSLKFTAEVIPDVVSFIDEEEFKSLTNTTQ